MMLLLSLACAPDVSLTPVTDPCQDVNLSDLPPSELLSSTEGGVIKVWLSNVLEPTGLEFNPTLEPKGRELAVRADWKGEPGDVDFCYQPTVTIEGLKGKLEVQWYLEVGDEVAYDILEVKGE